MSPAGRVAFRFSVFDFDPLAGELRKNGRKVRVQSQPLEVLHVLVRRPGEVVTREELQQALWPGGVTVEFERGLNNAIGKLRDALGDDPGSPRFIETIPRHGYRFVASVDRPGPPIEAPSIEGAGRRYRPRAPTAMAVAAVLAPTGTWLTASRWGAPPTPPIRAIAVLPLANLSGDRSQDYFADGITEELTTELARIGRLKVIARASALAYKDTRKPLAQIAHELGVDAVVQGSVARSGGKVRITAQLIDAATDGHVWADSYERDVGDVLSIQDSIAQSIARAVHVTLTPSETQRLARPHAVVPAAYEAYLKGRHDLTRQSPAALKAAQAEFRQAIDLDPVYAPAYAGLADTFDLFANYEVMTPKEAFPLAKAAADRSLQLDETLADAHASLGFAKNHYDWDWRGAAAEYKRALALNPSSSVAHLRYAEYLSTVGRHAEAVAEVGRAAELDPLSIVISSNVGRVLYHARRYDDAIRQLEKTLALDPGRGYTRRHLGMAFEQKGLFKEAEEQIARADAQLGIGESDSLAHLYAVSGRAAQARRVLHDNERVTAPRSWFFVAAVYGALGDKDGAFRCLEQAYEDRDFFLSFVYVHPYMDPLRSDPRFAALLKRIGLPGDDG